MEKLDYSKIFIKDACPTSIGGQAVMEGVMMQGPDRIALAMRLPSGELYLRTRKKKASPSVMKVPFVRGIVAFALSLVNGMQTLMESADILERYAPEEYSEEPGKLETWINDKFGSRAAWNFMMTSALIISVLISVIFFVILPTWVVNFLGKWIGSAIVLNLIEGLLRIAMFIGYVAAIRNMEDIKTLFRYHGAEHKTIHCYENGLELLPEKADIFYTLHPRCGTSFLVFVLLISLLLFSFLGWPNLAYRILSRLLLIPVIAGISYELLKWAGRSNGAIVRILSYPGLMLQKLTTAEPTLEQLEVAILALKAVLENPETADIDGFVDKTGKLIKVEIDDEIPTFAFSKQVDPTVEPVPESEVKVSSMSQPTVRPITLAEPSPEKETAAAEAEAAVEAPTAVEAEDAKPDSEPEEIVAADAELSAEPEAETAAAQAAGASEPEVPAEDAPVSDAASNDEEAQIDVSAATDAPADSEADKALELAELFGGDLSDVDDIPDISDEQMNEYIRFEDLETALAKSEHNHDKPVALDEPSDKHGEKSADKFSPAAFLSEIHLPDAAKVKGFFKGLLGIAAEEADQASDLELWKEGSEVMSRKLPDADEPEVSEEAINEAIKFLDGIDHDGYTIVAADSDDVQSLAASIAEYDARQAKARTMARRYTNDITTIENALEWGQAALGMVENGKRDATTIMSYATGLSRTELITRGKELMREEDFEVFDEKIQARLMGTPLQYIIGMQEFMGLPFRVNPSVLIPRQDTEVLAEKVIDILNKSDVPHPDVLDMCTGSGAIGVSIAAKVPRAYVTMSDASEDALHTAMNNAGINGVNNRCIFLLGDMFDALPEFKRFDLIVCNPPYVKSAVIDTLATEVKDHEPRMALDGGDDGLDYYRIIADHSSEHLRSGGILALEIGDDQAGSVKRLLMKSGTYDNIRKYKDLAGRDRVLIAERI